MALAPKQLRKQRRIISMIFQSFNLLEQRTALDNICFPMELAGVQKKQARMRAMELLETVGLPDKKDAYPVQLSGGQKQRIAIARALASNPEVLLCDEATSALDPQTTRDVLRLIQDINKRLGITVIIITHDMSVIEEICGKVAILNHGVVAETGLVTDVFSHPKTEAGRRLVYPDGLPFELSEGRVIRVAFNGGTAYQPLIASLAIDCGVIVNILGADTRNIDGKAYGTMLLGLPESEADAAKALSYIQSQKDITVEEVRDYHA
jgi:D-methionine transport system ATP-binding protein